MVVETDITLSYSFCEAEGQEDCVLGQSGFTLSGYSYSNTGVTVSYLSNPLGGNTFGDYDPQHHAQMVSFLNIDDCKEKDVYFSFTINVPKNRFPTTTTLKDLFLMMSTGYTQTIDVSATLNVSGTTATGTTRIDCNTTDNDYQQYLMLSGATLDSTAHYDRDEIPMFRDAHTLYVYTASIDAQLVLVRKNSDRNTLAVKFERDFVFYMRVSDCFSVPIVIPL